MERLLVLLFIQTVANLSSGDWEHPHYSYRCLENEKLEFFGVHPNSTIEIDGKKEDHACSLSQDKLGVVSIKYACMNYSTANKALYAIVIVNDTEFDGPSRQQPSTPTTTVGGHGHHQFLISCRDIPEKGIIKTVAHVFKEKDYNKLPDNYKEVSDVEMRFKAVNNTAAPDISTIYIGDEFYMFIKYMGEQPYTVIPEECTAFGETWIAKGREESGDNFVELWNIYNYSNSTPKACVRHKELLEVFGRYNETLIYTKMYGFRFKDKDFVTITCQVKIYNQGSITAVNKTNLCMAIPTNTEAGRRKRNIENVPFQTKALTKRLRVFDNKDVYLAENNGQRIKWETSLWMMIFVTATLHTWRADS